jgi:hypothetical protein
MAIQIEWTDREASPRCFCDYCGVGITAVAEGVALWEERDVTAVGRRDFFITHRSCVDLFQRSRLSCTVGDWMKQDLGWLLARLNVASGFGTEEHAAHADQRVSL